MISGMFGSARTGKFFAKRRAKNWFVGNKFILTNLDGYGKKLVNTCLR